LCLKESSTVTLSLGSRTIFSSLERARPNRVELAAIDPKRNYDTVEPYDSIETRKQPSGMHCILKHCKQD
jgi:hypothetical protein